VGGPNLAGAFGSLGCGGSPAGATGLARLARAPARCGVPAAATDAAGARGHLEAALTVFTQAKIPYRAAQTRLSLAALLQQADPAVAAAEAGDALTVFEDLGAGRDANALLHSCGNSA
jgi:hypothetical protein